MTHDDEVRAGGEDSSLASWLESNRIHHLLQHGVDGVATAIDEGQREQRLGDSSSQLDFKLAFQRFGSPRCRLQVRLV